MPGSNSRGLLWVLGAKVFFVLASYAMHVALPRLLGSAAEYGAFATGLNLFAMANSVFLVSTIYSVSQLTSADATRADEVLRASLKQQALWGMGIASLLTLLAPLFTRHVLLDASLAPMMRWGAWALAANALYATAVGSVNGRKRFATQARLDMLATFCRLSGVLLAAWWAQRALASIAGMTLGIGVAMVSALSWVGLGKKRDTKLLFPWWSVFLPMACYHLLIQGMFQLDVVLLKRAATEFAPLQWPINEAVRRSSQITGYYRAAQSFAFIPYQLLLAASLVLFPQLAKAKASGRHEEARQTLRQALRYSWLAGTGIAAPIAGCAPMLLTMVYPEGYAQAYVALRILCLTMLVFSLFVMMTTALNAQGYTLISVALAGLGCLTLVLVNRLLLLLQEPVPQAAWMDTIVRSTALATASGVIVATVAGVLVIHRVLKVRLIAASFLRGAIAAALGYLTAWILATPSWWTLIAALVLGVLVHQLSLLTLREWHRDELNHARTLLKRLLGLSKGG